MSFIAAAVIAGPAIAQGLSAHSAADKQSAAAQQANQVQQQVYQQAQQNFQPYQQAGTTALSQMSNPDLSRQFTGQDLQAGMDPGYQFRIQQGQKAIERSAAARGGLQSSGAMQALQNFGQNAASQEYQNAYNRFTGNQQQRFGQLNTLANMGMGAAQGVAGAGSNYASQYGQNVTGAANAQGAADVATGNAVAGGINNLVKLGTSAIGM